MAHVAWRIAVRKKTTRRLHGPLGGGQREISKGPCLDVIQNPPRTAHPMGRAADGDQLFWGWKTRNWKKKKKKKTDAGPRILKALHQHDGEDSHDDRGRFNRLRKRAGIFIPPRSALGFVENFFHMVFGPRWPAARKSSMPFEVSLILYAETRLFNASTFTARTVVFQLVRHLQRCGRRYICVAEKARCTAAPNEAVMHMPVGSRRNRPRLRNGC